MLQLECRIAVAQEFPLQQDLIRCLSFHKHSNFLHTLNILQLKSASSTIKLFLCCVLNSNFYQK